MELERGPIMAASAEHGISGWSFTMRLPRGALPGIGPSSCWGDEYSRCAALMAMGFAMQVLVILVLPRTPQAFVQFFLPLRRCLISKLSPLVLPAGARDRYMHPMGRRWRLLLVSATQGNTPMGSPELWSVSVGGAAKAEGENSCEEDWMSTA